MKLNSKSVLVQSNLSCGMLGVLYLTISPAVYATLSGTAFVVPFKPGAAPVIPDRATGTHIADLRYTFQASTALFNQYDLTDKALRQLLLSAVEEMYIRSLRHHYSRYVQTTTRQLLEHLYETYNNISPADLQSNDARLRSPYDANHPVENLFDQVKDSVNYAAAGDTPYTPEQVVDIAFQILFQTGLFLDDYKTWKRKPPNEKT